MFSVFRKIPKNALKNRYFSHFYFAGAGRPAPVKTQYSRQKRNTTTEAAAIERHHTDNMPDKDNGNTHKRKRHKILLDRLEAVSTELRIAGIQRCRYRNHRIHTTARHYAGKQI